MITDYYCVSGENNSKVAESLLQLSMPGPAVNEGGRRREGEGREKWGKVKSRKSFFQRNPLWQVMSPHVHEQ